MEEPKSKQTPIPTTHLTATVPLPQDPPVPKPPQPQPNKRNLPANNADFHDSAYFKIRALACQLRPHFIQVLRTPDFRNCKEAHEIRTQVKLVVDLYKQMIAETHQHETFVSVADRPFGGDNLLGKHFSGGHRKGIKSGTPLPKPKPDYISRQSFIIGGSVSGWNFITFSGSKPVYYGVTKESLRSNHKKPFAHG